MENLLLWAVIIGLYFVPSLVANYLEHRNLAAIAALNLFLGWTLLGWVGALVWALTASSRDAQR